MEGWGLNFSEITQLLEQSEQLDQEVKALDGGYPRVVQALVNSFFSRFENVSDCIIPFIKLPGDIESRLSKESQTFLSGFSEITKVKTIFALHFFEFHVLLQHKNMQIEVSNDDNIINGLLLDIDRCKELMQSDYILKSEREALQKIEATLSFQLEYFESITKIYTVNEAQSVVLKRNYLLYPKLRECPGLVRIIPKQKHGATRGLPFRAALLKTLVKLLDTGKHGEKGKMEEGIARIYNDFFNYTEVKKITKKDVQRP